MKQRASLGRQVVSGSEVPAAAAAADKVIYWRLASDIVPDMFSLLYSLRFERFTKSGPYTTGYPFFSS